MKLERKFHTLRTLATIYNIIAALFLAFTFLFCAVIIISVFLIDGFPIVVAILLIMLNLFLGFVAAVMAKSLAETISLFLAIEESTRKTGIAVEELYTLTENIVNITENTRATALILHDMNNRSK